MNTLNNMKIGTKLMAAFVLVAALVAIIGIVGVLKIRTIDAADTMLYEKATAPMNDALDMATYFQQIRVNVRDAIIADTPAEIQGFVDRTKELAGLAKKAEENYAKSFIDDQDKKNFEALAAAFDDYRKDGDRINQLALARKDAEAIALMRGDAKTSNDAVQKAIDTLAKYMVDEGKKISDANTVTANSAVTMMSAVAVVGFLLAIGMGILLTRAITRPLGKVVGMLQELAKGHLGLRLKLDRRDEIGVLASAMDGFADDLQGTVIGTMKKIASGDLSTDVAAKDAQDEIAPALKNTLEALRGLVAEAGALAQAAVAGKLATRGNAAKFEGGYRQIVQGVNETLDAVIGPLNVAAEYVDRISKGDIPAKITDTYNGDFNEIKNNLNQCIGAVNAMSADATTLAKAAVDGKLATRADASKHQGDFRKIVQGVNETLDAVIGPLNVAAEHVDRISKGDIPAKITDTYNGDFNAIKRNLNQCIDAVNAMSADAMTLAKAAVDGKLATRADATKHQGDFRKIVQGVDDCLDAVIRPLNVAAEYVERISKGNIPAKITDTYNGDFNEIKNNLNQCIDAVNTLVADANLLAQAAVEGKLATRADATKHQGDFRKIVQGVDDCLDAVIGPLNVAAEYVDRISKGDIPAKITDSYNGDFNEIKNNLNQCIGAEIGRAHV